MIVNHSGRLHQRVADRRADELKPASLQIAAHRIGFGCPRGHVGHTPPPIQDWFAADETPQVGVEGAEFLAHGEEQLCVLDRGRDFQSVPYDSGVAKQPLEIACTVMRNFFRPKSIERLPIVVSFVQNRGPAQSRLCTFKDQKLEEQSVVVHRDAPFFIMISDVRFGCSPGAARHDVHKLVEISGAVSVDVGPTQDCRDRIRKDGMDHQKPHRGRAQARFQNN